LLQETSGVAAKNSHSIGRKKAQEAQKRVLFLFTFLQAVEKGLIARKTHLKGCGYHESIQCVDNW